MSMSLHWMNLDDVDSITEALAKKKEQDDDDIVLALDESDTRFFRYQNPIQNNRLIIDVRGFNQISKAVIYNVHGQVEFFEKDIDLSNGKIEFNFEDKSPGLYFLKVDTYSLTKVLRVIKI